MHVVRNKSAGHKNRAVTVAIREIYVSSIKIMVSADIWIYAKTQLISDFAATY